ncbi:MAG: hypothetical protein O2816_11890 [Planctomycetota bacterium]|nr:hypothetical protein [Planctomycetota bacterium]
MKHLLQLSLALAPLLPSAGLGQTQLVAGEAPEAQSRPADDRTLVVYDIADLTGHDALREVDLTHAGGANPNEAERLLQALQEREEARALVLKHAGDLRTAIAEYMQPELLQDAQTLRTLNGGALILLGSEQQHVWTRQFLDLQRKTNGLLDMQARLLTVPDGVLESMGIESSAKIYPSQEAFAPILEALLAKPGVEVVTTPRLMTFPRQRANVSVINQVAYVKDYDLVVVEPGAVEIVDPVIDVIQEGVTLDLWCVPIERGVFGLDAEMQVATLERPIPTSTLQIGNLRHEVSISLPHVTEVGVSSRMSLPDGAVAVLITPDPAEQVHLVMVLSLRYVSEAALEGGDLGPPRGSDGIRSGK